MQAAWHHATQGPQGPPPPPTRSCPLAPVTGCLGGGGAGIWLQRTKCTLHLGAAGCSLTTLGMKLLRCDPSAPGGLRYKPRGRRSRKKQTGYRDVRPGACPPQQGVPLVPIQAPPQRCGLHSSPAHTLVRCFCKPNRSTCISGVFCKVVGHDPQSPPLPGCWQMSMVRV